MWGGNIDLQLAISENATVMYVCNYMTKGEKAMGETLKRVTQEYKHENICTQMQNIKNEFLGKRSFGAPESAMQVLSLWLMKKSRKITNVNTDMQEECVSLPKSQTQLAQMDDDDVFATSIIDRYSACPDSLNNMCLATFAVNYNVCYSVSKDDDIIGIGEADEEEIDNDDIELENQSNMQPMITLKQKLGYMRKRKQEAILRTRRYKISTEPEKYYHSKLLLYYP